MPYFLSSQSLFILSFQAVPEHKALIILSLLIRRDLKKVYKNFTEYQIKVLLSLLIDVRPKLCCNCSCFQAIVRQPLVYL